MIASTRTNRVAAEIYKAFDSVGPDRVIRTSPVPEAQSSSETIELKYLLMGMNLPFSTGYSRCRHCHSSERDERSTGGYGDCRANRDIGV